MMAQTWLLRYSAAVCRRPRLVIAGCVAATLACSLGLFRVKIITNPDLIWVPPNSLANRQKAFFDEAFDPFFRVNQVFFVAEEPETDMIAKRYLQRVMCVQRAIENANFTTAGGEVRGFDSLCFMPIDGEGCLVESPSQYWVSDPVVLAGDPSPSLTAACQTSDAFLASRSPCMDEIGTPVMRGVVFGDIGVNSKVVSPDPCGGGVPKAGALVLTFLLNNYKDAEYQRLAEQWEKEVFLAVVEEARDLLENDVQAPMKVSYMAQRSVEDSLSVEAGENAWVLVVSYLSMFLYVSLILGNPCDIIRSRYSLALTGITIVIASLMTTIGLLSMAGVGTTLIVWEVVPFLTLAIGVDNMVILSREFDRLETTPEFETAAGAATASSGHNPKGDLSEGASATGPTFSWASTSSVLDRVREEKDPVAELRVEDRMGAAVSKVAPSILGAAVCEAVAFLVGALTDIPALRQFCLVAATAVLVGFVLQISWFMAALSLDARRVAQGRLDLAPWMTRTEDSDNFECYNTRKRNDPSRGLRAPLLGGQSSGRWGGGQRLKTFLRQFGSELVSPPLTNSNAHSSIAPEDMDWNSPRSSRGGLRRGGGSRNRAGGDGNRSDDDHLDADGARGRRSLTAEFGTGSETNPALFSTAIAASTTTRPVPASASDDKTGTDMGGGGGGGSGGGVRMGMWVVDHRTGRRERLEDPDSEEDIDVDVGGSSSEGRRSRGRAASRARSGRYGSSVYLGEGSVVSDDGGSSRLDGAVGGGGGGDGSSNNSLGKGYDHLHTPPSSLARGEGGGHHHEGGGGGGGGILAGLGGEVVDGYVSLGSNPHHNHRRHGSQDERDGGAGLLLGGLPRDGQGQAGGRERGAEGAVPNSGLALSVFREQLYEEGRGKGGKGGNMASRFLERHYLPALFSKAGRFVTLSGAAVLAALGLMGLAGLQMGLEPQLASPTDFYLQDYFEAQFSKGEAGPPAYVVFSDVDYFGAYHDEEARQAFRGVSTGLAQLQRYVQAPIYSWFDTMIGWLHRRDTLAADCPTQTEVTDEASFYAMVELFLSIPIESQCCQSYGVCGAQFETDVTFDNGDEDGIRRIEASRLRFNMQPLNTQRDYVNSYYYVKLVTDKLADKLPERYKGQRKAKATKAVGNLAFPYSLYFVFYEQYAFIQGVALQNIALAIAVVFLSIAVLSGFALAAVVSSLVLGTTLGTVGLVWIWGVFSSEPYAVSINAVSVCNLVMSLGLSVEFCLHVAVAFQRVPGTRQERAEAAMKSAGASVLTGITLTKLVGVSVLAIAPSMLFRVYYFRMYMATVAVGAFQGLGVLPVLLSMYGPKPPPSTIHLPGHGSGSWADGDQWAHDDDEDDFSGSRKAGAAGYYDLGGGGTPPGRRALALGWNRGRGPGHLSIWDAWGGKEEAEEPPGRSSLGENMSMRARPARGYVSLGSGTPRSSAVPSEAGAGDAEVVGVGVGAGDGVHAQQERELQRAQEQLALVGVGGDGGRQGRGEGAAGERSQAQAQEQNSRPQQPRYSTASSNRSTLSRRGSGYSSRSKPGVVTSYSPW